MSAAIPTAYHGVNFRSRLEAKWAAFFDLVGWEWVYEPVDLDGWIPDFLLRGAAPIFVEVKPFCDPKEPLVAETQAKIERAYGGPNEILLLGAVTGWCGGCFNDTVLGLLRDNDYKNGWGHAMWQSPVPRATAPNGNMGWRADFFHDWGSYQHRISGAHDGDHHLREGDPVCLQSRWKEAGNRVQWRARAS